MSRFGYTLDRIARRFGGEQQRSMSYQDVWGTGDSPELFTGGNGVLSLVPLYSAVRLITDQFASTPINGYRSQAGGVRERLPSDPSFLTPPTPSSRAVWKTQLITGLLTRGNAVGLHTAYGSDGFPSQTCWLPLTDVQCDDENPARVKYYYLGRYLEPGTFVHIPWIVMPGRAWGLSPLGMFKLLWETGQAAQTLTRNFYNAGGVPSGHMKNTARELLPEQADETKRKFKIAVANRDVLVTGNDWEYNAIGLPADQLEFVSSLKLTATQIAAIYGIAPEDIGGESGASLQYSTVEMNDIKLSTRTMRPWYTRVEDGLEQCTPRGQYVKFNADVLIRSDLKSRMEAHEIALRTGLEDQPEARKVEDKPPMTPEAFKVWRETYKPAPAAPAEATREGQK